MNFLRTDVICMSNVLKYHSAKVPGKVDSPFEVRFDMNASRKRKNTKPKGFFEKLKEQRNQRKADRAKQTDRKTDILKKTGSGIVTLLLVILPPAVCFYLMECYSHNPFAMYTIRCAAFNFPVSTNRKTVTSSNSTILKNCAHGRTTANGLCRGIFFPGKRL